VSLPEDGLHLAWAGDLLLLPQGTGEEARLPTARELERALEAAAAGVSMTPAGLELPELEGRPVRVYDVPEALEPPEGWGLRTLRSLHTDLSPELFQLVVVMYTFQGIAMVHGLVAARAASAGWLVTMYLVLILLPPTAVIALSAAGFSDTWVDYRRRWGASA